MLLLTFELGPEGLLKQKQLRTGGEFSATASISAAAFVVCFSVALQGDDNLGVSLVSYFLFCFYGGFPSLLLSLPAAVTACVAGCG